MKTKVDVWIRYKCPHIKEFKLILLKNDCKDEITPEGHNILKAEAFKDACIGYEKLYGERAENDYRNTSCQKIILK